MEIPPKDWGARSVPIISSRYPLWQQTDFLDDVDNGRFLIPDAPDMRRETIITSVVDGRPEQVLRVPGNSWWPLLAAIATGGFFIGATFHAWVITGDLRRTCLRPDPLLALDHCRAARERTQRDAGCGYVLPLYVSGPHSVGWWAMFITVLADGTAFVSLIFGYFFYWTVRRDLAAAAGRRARPGCCRRSRSRSWSLAAGLIRFAVAALRRSRAGPFQARGLARLRGPARRSPPCSCCWLLGAGPRPDGARYPAIVWTILRLPSPARGARACHGPLRAGALLGRPARARATTSTCATPRCSGTSRCSRGCSRWRRSTCSRSRAERWSPAPSSATACSA